MDAIRTDDLCMSYGRRAVLRRVNLHVPAGELVGFLGPNGSGKTTTIRILLGLLRASSGRATIFGRHCWNEGPLIRSEVGYLPGEVCLYGNLTGAATLNFLAAARRIDCRTEIARLQTAFDLDLGKRIRNYSTGMKQKLGLIQALMHRPRILILDEPTSGLDPLVRQTLYDELRAVAAEGRTVLFSSHTLSEVEQLCNEVAILRDGQLVEQQRVAVLRRRAVRRLELQLRNGDAAPPSFPDGLRVLDRSGTAISAVWSGDIRALLAWLAAQDVRDVSIAPPDLESLFLAYYRDVDEAAAK